jgi:hypothetical protein
MKTILKTTIAMVGAALFFTGCETEDKLNKISENIEKLTQVQRVEKKGVSCEDSDALEVLKRIVDKKFNGDFEIEKNNIVIWEYSPVGRYTCKAKIKKVGERKKKEKISNDKNAAMLAIMTQVLAPAQYGIGAEGGWVNYYTYETTISTKENRHLYVEIFSENNEN